MPIHNADVSKTFQTYADLLEIDGANPFRVRAYRNAAQVIGTLSRPVAEMEKSGEDLTELPGIGDDLAGKIREIVRSGKLGVLEKLQHRLNGHITDLLDLGGLGPKRVKMLHEKLGISTLQDLQRCLRQGKLENIHGFGEKTIERIEEDLKRKQTAIKRFKLSEAEPVAESLLKYLEALAGPGNVTAAGSYRRRKETVGDLDFLAVSDDGTAILKSLVEYEDVSKVLSHGTTRATVLLRGGLQIDLRVVPKESYGAALHYFTGSKSHNIAIRALGVKRRLKINEYGVFRGKRRISGRTETEVYRSVGLPYIEPELRENRGEIEAARTGELPRLITLQQIRGDLHMHTKWSDGHYTVREMASAAKERGYEYIAITDHSQRLTVANGLTAKRLGKQIEEIEKVNAKLKGIVVLKSCEVDILEDGKLDLSDAILRELDVVVCSIHSKLNLPRVKQTERVIRAMDNRCFHIFAHPTGRLIGARDGYDIDIDRILRAAKERGCYLEVNGHPDRLDLSDIYCRAARELGVKLSISTDSHNTSDLDFMKYGVGQARRGWLEKKDVLNARPLKELRKILRR